MERYFDYEGLCQEVARALDNAFESFGFSRYDTLAVCAVLEAISSPLKLHKLRGTPLSERMGLDGTDSYLASTLVGRVETIKRPGSLIVNDVMDAIVAALAAESPLSERNLFRDSLRVFLKDGKIGHSDIEDRLRTQPSFQPAFQSALQYLQEGMIVSSDPTGRNMYFI